MPYSAGARPEERDAVAAGPEVDATVASDEVGEAEAEEGAEADVGEDGVADFGENVGEEAGADIWEEDGAGAGEDDGEALVAPLGVSPGVRRRRRLRLREVLVAIALAVVVIAVVGFFRVSHDINPGGRPGKVVTVVVPAGASTLQIAHILAKAGVVHGPDVFEVYVKLHGAGPLLAGTYRLVTNESYSAVIRALEQGPVLVTAKLVVPEGFTIAQIAAAVGRLKGIGITAHDFMAAATDGQVRSPYEPAGTDDLEGLLFPATYPVEQGESAAELVTYMVETFDQHASQIGLAAGAKRLGLSPYQVVTVASIVEREAKLQVDRGPIASVIYNRLSQGAPIGADSTLLYGLGDPKGPVNFDEPNPYNTRLHKGLPPTPISNPGIPSLEAALHPPKTSYFYWVEVNPDGKMGFASTAAQFDQLRAECQKAGLGC
ncbi:MAG: endolytic transglycosylase MltG [Acidimicrobiales bacterium]